MIFNLVSKNDPIIKEQMPVFDFDNPSTDPMELFENMKESLIHHGGIGLSANQIGLHARMFVMGDTKNPDSIVGVYNPKLLAEFGKEVFYVEGCLTFPGLFIKVKRHDGVRVRYTTHKGVTDAIKFDGLTSRVFQHELDHLNGITFESRAHKIHLDRARNKQRIWKRRQKRIIEEIRQHESLGTE